MDPSEMPSLTDSDADSSSNGLERWRNLHFPDGDKRSAGGKYARGGSRFR